MFFYLHTFDTNSHAWYGWWFIVAGLIGGFGWSLGGVGFGGLICMRYFDILLVVFGEGLAGFFLVFGVVVVSGLCARFRKVVFHLGCWLVRVWVTGFFPRFNLWLVGAAGSVPRFNLFASSSFAISTMLGFWIVGLVGLVGWFSGIGLFGGLFRVGGSL